MDSAINGFDDYAFWLESIIKEPNTMDARETDQPPEKLDYYQFGALFGRSGTDVWEMIDAADMIEHQSLMQYEERSHA